MKRITIGVSVAVLVFGVAILAQTQTESVEQELIKLENKVNDAWVKRDLEAYASFLADGYICTDSLGEITTKAQNLAGYKSAKDTITSAISDDFKKI